MKDKNEFINTNALLKLVNIKKDYVIPGVNTVHALKGITLNFRKNEFVSILGPSGCGKTTLLNIIGGLDKYTEGDLIIAGKSTKKFKDHDWDVYRNHRIGFIFQSYNLIPHQTVLENVELALTIAGLSKKERVLKAKNALDKVGLQDYYKKHPNQLSGGQCQRVAIARALVNEPDILLADEPTGALDTKTSKQIMELITEISKETLVIMVTHNPDIANEYSTRIINLLDGLVVNDSNPFNDEIKDTKENFEIKNEKAKMSLVTSFNLSLRNLLSKAKRTVLVCIAGSIGIVGVSTVLAVSSGIHSYINNMQDDMLSGNPITITESTYDLTALMDTTSTMDKVEALKEAGYVNVNSVVESLVKRSNQVSSIMVKNEITQDYIDYVCAMPEENYSAIYLDYGLNLSHNIYTGFKEASNSEAKQMSVTAITNMYTQILNETDVKDYSSYITQLASSFEQAPNNNEYILSQYDLLSGKCAKSEDEVMIVISKQDELSDVLLAQLGYYTQEEFINIVYKATESELYNESIDKRRFSYDELLNKEFTWYPNDDVFTKNTDDSTKDTNPFYYNAYANDSMENEIKLKVVGILQAKEDISYGCLSSGFFYTEALTNKILTTAADSNITKYFNENESTSISSGVTTSKTFPFTKINSGITYTYNYSFEGVDHTDVVGFVGSESTMSSILSMFMGGKSGGSKYYNLTLREIGGINLANKISIYPTNFDNKYLVTDYLDKWNGENDITYNEKTLTIEDRSQIKYTDNLELIIGLINTMIDMVTYALIVFTALSLLVSTVMIGIITYVSVVERVKEIGVIRSLGGAKKDVSSLFIAETFIIGLTSGIFGILITELFSFIINMIVGKLAGIYTIANLSFEDGATMIVVSIILTLISGVIPARAAANKNPVDALRTE